MSRILNFDTIHEYNTFLGIETFHPLISSIIFRKSTKNSNMYAKDMVFILFF